MGIWGCLFIFHWPVAPNWLAESSDKTNAQWKLADHSVPEQTHFHFVGIPYRNLRSCVPLGCQGLLLEDWVCRPPEHVSPSEAAGEHSYWAWLDLPAEFMKTDGWAPPMEFLDSWGLGSARESAFLTSSQVTPWSLVQGPPFENNCLKGNFLHHTFWQLSWNNKKTSTKFSRWDCANKEPCDHTAFPSFYSPVVDGMWSFNSWI